MLLHQIKYSKNYLENLLNEIEIKLAKFFEIDKEILMKKSQNGKYNIKL